MCPGRPPQGVRSTGLLVVELDDFSNRLRHLARAERVSAQLVLEDHRQLGRLQGVEPDALPKEGGVQLDALRLLLASQKATDRTPDAIVFTHEAAPSSVRVRGY